MASSKTKVRRKLTVANKAFLMTIVLLIIGFGLFFYLWTRSQEEYYHERNLRQLAVMSFQIKSRLEGFKKSFRYYLEEVNKADTSKQRQGAKSSSLGVDTLDLQNFLKLAGLGEPSHPGDDTSTHNRFYLHRISRTSRSEQRVFIERDPEDDSLSFLGKTSHGIISVTCTDSFSTILGKYTNNSVFDDVLLLDRSGNTIYERSSKIIVAHLDSVQDTQGRHLQFNRDKQGTGIYSAVIAGEDVHLYSQPLELELADWTDGEPSTQWMICGIVKDERATNESRAISTDKLVMFVVAILLITLSWPFMKFSLMSPRAFIRPGDVLLLLVSAVVASAIIAFSARYFFTVHSQMHEEFDSQLRLYGGEIESNFNADLKEYLSELHHFNDSLDNKIYHTKVKEGAEVLRTNSNWDRIALIDSNGKQVAKWAREEEITPNVNVGERDYVTAHLNDRAWRMDSSDSIGTFFVEPTYSLTTGEFVTTFSIPFRSAKRPDVRVAALDALPPSLTNTVTIPGFEFSIVDMKGTVLFHSRPERRLYENFFDECRDDDELRSAIWSHAAESLDVNYWGNEYRLSVRPMTNVPWVILTFLDKKAIRTATLEVLSSSMILWFLYSLVLGTLILAAYIQKRWYANWAWPHPYFNPNYVQLIYLYSLHCILLMVFRESKIFSADVRMLLTVVVSMYLVALTYLKLQQRHPSSLYPWSAPLRSQELQARKYRTLAFATHASFAAMQFLIFIIFSGRIQDCIILCVTSSTLYVLSYLWLTRKTFSPKFELNIPYWFVGLIFLYIVITYLVEFQLGNLVICNTLLLGSVTAALILLILVKQKIPFWSRQTQSDVKEDYRKNYTIAVTLLLLCVVVQPAITFFKVAFDLQIDLFVRHGQLSFYNELEAQNKLKHGLIDTTLSRSIYASHFFSTKSITSFDSGQERGSMLIFKKLHEIVPLFDESSVQTHYLIEDTTADAARLWRCVDTGSVHTVQLKKPAKSEHPFMMQSQFMSKFLTKNPFLTFLKLAIYVLIMIFLFYRLVKFIAKKVFLLSADEFPPFTRYSKTEGKLVFVLNYEDVPISDLLESGTYKTIDLVQYNDKASYRNQIDDELKDKPVVLVDRFETGKEDSTSNLKKLNVLERLASRPNIYLVIFSTIEPFTQFRVCDEPEKDESTRLCQNGGEIQRWQKFFGECRFVHAHSRHDVEQKVTLPFLSTESDILREEIMREALFDKVRPFGSRIQNIARSVLADFHESMGGWKIDQFVDELLERARPLYYSIWNASLPDERRVLYQIAKSGFVNSKSVLIVEQLLRKKLIVRNVENPSLHIMNESFRLFVKSAMSEEEIAPTREELESNWWERVKAPLLLLSAAVLIFLFATQKDFLSSTMAIITAVAAALPLIFRIVGSFQSTSVSSTKES